jgi:hypothetical protein
MKWNFLGALALSTALASQSFGNGMLDRMLGSGCGCCAEPSCNCCEKSCCAEQGCCGDNGCCGNGCGSCCGNDGCCFLDGLFGWFDGCGCGNGCCEASCGCEQGACCGHEASCGCESGCCGNGCGSGCCGNGGCGLFDGLFGLFDCGRGCGCGDGCGCSNGCCEASCAFNGGCCGGNGYGGNGGHHETSVEGDEPAAAAPAEAGAAVRPIPPRPMADPSAKVAHQRNVVRTSFVR